MPLLRQTCKHVFAILNSIEGNTSTYNDFIKNNNFEKQLCGKENFKWNNFKIVCFGCKIENSLHLLFFGTEKHDFQREMRA